MNRDAMQDKNSVAPEQESVWQESVWIAQIRAQLDREMSDLSVTDQMRLNEARAAAIAVTRKPRLHWQRFSLITLAGSAAIFALVWIMVPKETQLDRDDAQVMAMFEDAFSSQDITSANNVASDAINSDTEEAAVADDLAFYSWLAEQSALGASKGS
jgi:hypothetical protein